jgi:hypothetical protein
MWDALNFDHLQSISTDHCPFTDEQKRLGLGDFSKIPNGLAAIQHRLPLLWEHGVKAGRMTPNRFVEVTPTAIANIFGLTNKGTLAPGADADIVIFDPARARVLDGDVADERGLRPLGGPEGLGVAPADTEPRDRRVRRRQDPDAPRARASRSAACSTRLDE